MVALKKTAGSKKGSKVAPAAKPKVAPVAKVSENSGASVDLEKDDKKDVQVTSSTYETDLTKVQAIKDQARVALAALRKYVADRGGKSLFPDLDHSLHITIVYKKPALITNQGKAKIDLPHSPRTTGNSSVCIIMPDLDQTVKGRTDPDIDKQARQWAEKIEKDHGLTSQHYTKILTKRQLERECGQYAKKRALATQYDVFLVDARVGKSVDTFLGKEFHKAHKMPFWFNYTEPMVTAIEKSCSNVSFPLNRYMTRASVAVGHLGQATSDISDNVDVTIDRIIDVCPGGLVNLRSVYLQPASSQPSLPIYLDEGPASEVKLATKEKRKEQEKIADECSTLPEGLKLEVRRSGKVRVVKEESGQGVMYPTVNDEWDERDMPNTKPSINPKAVANQRQKKQKRKQAQEEKKANGAVAAKKKRVV